MLPVIFNDDNNVDSLETNKFVKLVLLFKLLIDNVELVDNEFNLLKQLWMYYLNY